MHVVPLQHPVGQELLSHTHLPVVVLHSWPVPHAPHATPPVPQEPVDCEPYGSHVPEAVQQPFGQVVASQAHWPVVVSHRPAAHTAHVAPPAPHCDEDCEAYATHVVPLQHPPGHDVTSHTHAEAPLEHSCPVAHEVQARPPVPHDALVCDA